MSVGASIVVAGAGRSARRSPACWRKGAIASWCSTPRRPAPTPQASRPACSPRRSRRCSTPVPPATSRCCARRRTAGRRWPLRRGWNSIVAAVALGAAAEVAGWAQTLREAGGKARRLSAAELAALTPGAASGLRGLYSPQEWRLTPPQAVRALRAAARAAGAGFTTGHVRDASRSARWRPAPAARCRPTTWSSPPGPVRPWPSWLTCAG